MGRLERAGVCHWTCPVEWNRHLRESQPVQGLKEIRGRLYMEIWADKQLASEKRVGRDLWAETQEKAGREKRELAQSKLVLVLETLDSPKWIP